MFCAYQLPIVSPLLGSFEELNNCKYHVAILKPYFYAYLPATLTYSSGKIPLYRPSTFGLEILLFQNQKMSVMKKINALIIIVLMVFGFTNTVQACDNSSFSLLNMTDLGGGQYEFTVEFCAGGGIGGAENGTGTWGINAVGASSFDVYPSTLTSPQTGAVYGADASFYYGSSYLVYDMISYPGTGFGADWWTTTAGGWGAAGSYCVQFTFVTTGMPTQLIMMGAEGAGVGVAPYGCNGLPEMEINFGMVADAGPSVNVCLGSSTTLTATGTGGTAPYSYLWSNGATTATNTVSPTANITYTVTVTDALGNTDTDDVPVYVNTPAVANAGVDKTITKGYGPSCVTLYGSATGMSAPYTYSWSTGSTGSNITVCPATTTTYTLTVSDYYGCTSTDNVTVTVKDVRCGPMLNKVYVCKNGTTKCITTGQVPSHLLSGWVVGACWMKLDEFVAESENPIAIFPNPASQNAEIVFVMEEDATAEIEIYNLSGQKYPLQNNMINGMGGQEITHEINVNELPAGIYQVFVTTSYGQVLTEKLAVVR